MTMSTHQMQQILEQDDWLRRMAHRLFHDGERARDAAQDVWAAELAGGRSTEPSRPWRFGVLRNLRREGFRADQRREAHAREMRARGVAVAPATDEVVADLQLREHATRALLALDEPWRTTLYLRYVNDLTVSAVAAQMGVAQSTASQRIGEGLETLRRELDSSYGEGRAAWLAALAPLARTGRRTGMQAGATWSPAAAVPFLVGALVAVAVGLAAFLWMERSAEPVPETRAVLAGVVGEPDGAQGGMAEEVSLSAVPDAPARVSLVVPSSDEEESAQGRVDEDEPKKARIRATVWLPDGKPAVGATWTLTSMGTAGGGRRAGPDQTGKVTAEGALDVQFVPADTVVLALRVSLEGYVTSGKQWTKLLPGDVEDLGKIRLVRAGTVSGRLVDAEGKTLLGKEWRLQMMAPGQLRGLPIAFGADFVIDPQTGAFTLKDVTPGKAQINFNAPGHGWQPGPVVTVVAGETTDVDIVHDGTFVEKQRPQSFGEGWNGGELPEDFGKRKPGDKKAKEKRLPNRPVDLTIELAMDEGVTKPDERIEAVFMRRDLSSSSGLSGKGTTLGPRTIDANAAEVLWIRGEDWIARFDAPTIGQEAEQTLKLDLKLGERRVRFLLDGSPLVKRKLQLQILPMQFVMRKRGGFLETDEDGFASVRLGVLPEGKSYRFSIDSRDPAEFMKFVEAPWPATSSDETEPLTLEFK